MFHYEKNVVFIVKNLVSERQKTTHLRFHHNVLLIDQLFNHIFLRHCEFLNAFDVVKFVVLLVQSVKNVAFTAFQAFDTFN